MTRFQRIKPCALALVLVLLLIGCGASSKNGGAISSPSSNASSTKTVQRYSSDKADAWMHWSGMSMADVVNEDETRGVKLGGVGFLRAPAGAAK